MSQVVLTDGMWSIPHPRIRGYDSFCLVQGGEGPFPRSILHSVGLFTLKVSLLLLQQLYGVYNTSWIHTESI